MGSSKGRTCLGRLSPKNVTVCFREVFETQLLCLVENLYCGLSRFLFRGPAAATPPQRNRPLINHLNRAGDPPQSYQCVLKNPGSML